MINDFTLDTDANPENMNNIIKNINKNEEDITAVKESVEGLGSQIGQRVNKAGDKMTGDLYVPSISMQRYNINTLSSTMTLTEQSEVEIDLGEGNLSGVLEVIQLGTWWNINSTGIVKKQISITSVGETIQYQSSKYTELQGYTPLYYMISDIYIKDGRKKIKLIQKANTKNAAQIVLLGYGSGFTDLKNATVGSPVVSTEPFVEPSMKPIENIITSGFASGWTGEIRYDKYREGDMHIQVTLTKSSDYGGGGTLLYTFPAGNRPAGTEVKQIMLLTTGGGIVLGSEAVCYIDSAGALRIVTKAVTTLTNARKIMCSFEYTARN